VANASFLFVESIDKELMVMAKSMVNEQQQGSWISFITQPQQDFACEQFVSHTFNDLQRDISILKPSTPCQLCKYVRTLSPSLSLQ
jgi:hypothetical protein